MTRQEEILKRLKEILDKHDGLESNIPVIRGHEYWNLKNELQKLNNDR